MDRFRKNYSDYFSIAVILSVVICLAVMKDSGTTAALCWLAVVFCLPFFVGRLISFNNLRFPDEGFALRFSLGLFICFFPAWTICAITGAPFGNIAVFSSFAVMSSLVFFVKRYVKKEVYVTHTMISGYLRGFAVFAVLFLIYFWMIGFNPVIDSGTENYMDFGFMQAIYRQELAIPYDIWMSGEKLNYYYLGQSVSAFLCRLACTRPAFGYNMMLATFISVTFLGVFEIIYAICARLFEGKKNERLLSVSGASAGAALAAFAANPHWILYGFFEPLLTKIMTAEDLERYWFCDPTVYIRSELGDSDNGKNEFPAYSVILGDLHAHVINVIFVLPLLALLFDMCFREDDEPGIKKDIGKLVAISVILGYFKGANYWDFAIYYVICGAVIVFCELKRTGMKRNAFIMIGIKAAIVTVLSYIAILPFTMNFVKMESGIGICDTHTPLFKFMVLWLPALAVCLWLIVRLYRDPDMNTEKNRVMRCGFLAFLLCTAGLVLLPEFIYVKDIYGESNARFNTMFKLTYQAFILFAAISGVAFSYILSDALKKRRRAVSFFTVFLLYILVSSYYTLYAANQFLGNITEPSQRKGISALEPLYDDSTYGFEARCADVIEGDPKKVVNILECAGDSYTHNDALSVYTGTCTPAGWFVHEWMWHNDPEQIKDRGDRVGYFYRIDDSTYRESFLRRYDIDYILVGPAEYSRYAVFSDGLSDLGEVVVTDRWMDRDLMLIKVKDF